MRQVKTWKKCLSNFPQYITVTRSYLKIIAWLYSLQVDPECNGVDLGLPYVFSGMEDMDCHPGGGVQGKGVSPSPLKLLVLKGVYMENGAILFMAHTFLPSISIDQLNSNVHNFLKFQSFRGLPPWTSPGALRRPLDPRPRWGSASHSHGAFSARWSILTTSHSPKVQNPGDTVQYL